MHTQRASRFYFASRVTYRDKIIRYCFASEHPANGSVRYWYSLTTFAISSPCVDNYGLAGFVHFFGFFKRVRALEVFLKISGFSVIEGGGIGERSEFGVDFGDW
jgi:hypothetical protein